jgi:hypothetical protein
MEELQWGFPIATTLSLNNPPINQREVKVLEVRRQTHPAQWVGLKAVNKSGGG